MKLLQFYYSMGKSITFFYILNELNEFVKTYKPTKIVFVV